ncbi:MAG: pantoate--beta-alanine ligase [Methylotenera sp.]|jgi:pantoate--beta-alanine ligase|uniref:pantoate--beta-alanine ligase n=1 Tax=Methylotenera sp. TaxID=2051956 RepID=UPI00271F416D|nr:pantoate--beta-alanine ligase [Methylotenera sp.]MDO9150463.1 pantoate--beta-alanine ligase [Methylotenera sp.]
MQRIHTANELRSTLNTKSNIAFIPTMGNLHDGHIALVSLAKQHGECVVASIFVNPLQFGPNEDLANYPRTLEADCKRLADAGADIVFIPSVKEMYPDFDGEHLNQTMTITPPSIAAELCGASRPGHFAGVATVVMKLFNLVMPQVAIFGKKDFQQVFVIKELVRQFNLPIQIIAGDTVREPSGLAMSSRNGYLTPTQKSEAAQLHQCLANIVHAVKQGNTNFTVLENSASQTLAQQGWLVDYVSVRATDTLKPATNQDKELVVLGAAKLGSTRLIDNIDFCAK